MDRRNFLEFLGLGVGVAATGCSTVNGANKPKELTSLGPKHSDALELTSGFNYDVLIRWDDPINSSQRFGFNNDYIACLPMDGKDDDCLMWVNHEYVNSMFVSGWDRKSKITKDQVDTELASLGGSIVRVQYSKGQKKWQVKVNDSYNRRVDGLARIPMVADRPIAGSKTAVGTFANCAGGVTPWGTVLTCEENYQYAYGENHYSGPGKKTWKPWRNSNRWHDVYRRSPEHYGWVVEVDLKTGAAKKLTGLGRFAHECATTVLAADGRCVVYSGDDANDQCLYKFIGDESGSLEKGSLYVANMESGKWIPMVRKGNPVLEKNFTDQTELLIRCRDGAKLLGGTPLDRPEDIEINPLDKSILVALTNNKPKGRPHGSILKVVEDGNDPLSMTFSHSTFVAGGKDSGISSPDNLAFDKKGNLWITNDISGSSIEKGDYKGFGNNGLYYMPTHGVNAGKVFQIASAPFDAELTGPYFAPSGNTLFLSVQHPGEKSKSLDKLRSHWPDGGESLPKPAVVAISGPMMDQLLDTP